MTTSNTTLVSTATDGTQGNGNSTNAVFSPNGTKILFTSAADNLVAGDTNGIEDIFVKDLTTDTVTLVTANASGVQGSGYNYNPVFASDGTKVLFHS